MSLTLSSNPARLNRRAVVAALAGYFYLHAHSSGGAVAPSDVAAAVRREPQPLIRRIERLEAGSGATAPD